MAKLNHGLSEKSLREALRAWLIPGLSEGDLMVEELGIENGSTRIDLAIASDGLHGYEIKSDFDTLDRLAHQMHSYHRVFDTVTIVTTEAFVRQVTALLPPWWGIAVGVVSDSDTTTLHMERNALPNPRQEARSLAALLWREEALTIIQSQASVSSRATRSQLYDLIAQTLNIESLKPQVIRTLRERQELRARDSRVKASPAAVASSAQDGDSWHLVSTS